LLKFVTMADLAGFARKENLTWSNREQGALYSFYMLNQARTKNQPAAFAYDRSQLVVQGFEIAPQSSAAFHAIGLDPELVEKWVHTDGREYVFLQNRQGGISQVFDGVNDGTYNYCSDMTCHMVLDVFPWILWGATLRDTTTPEQRAVAFRDAFTGLRLAKGGLDKILPDDL